MFLESDNFGVPESIIFEKCLEWSKHQADKSGIADVDESKSLDDIDVENNHVTTAQEYFNLIKYQIRFPVMDSEYFHSHVIDSTMLTNQECLDIVRYMNFSSKLSQIKEKVEKMWNCDPREMFNISSNMGITQQEINALILFLPETFQTSKWKLLFRASEHNFKASKFHQYCDNKYPTITIVKSKNYGNIFGGFTQASWTPSHDGDYGYKRDPNAFIFLLRRGKNIQNTSNTHNSNEMIPKACKVNQTYLNDCTIFAKHDRGPTFGMGHDLHLSDKCHDNIKSFSLWETFGETPFGSTWLAGSYHFSVQEYEVWHLQ